MSPASLVTGFTISALPKVVTTATELPGGLIEVELLVGPPGGLQAYVNKQLTVEQFLDYLATQQPATGSSGLTALELTISKHEFADDVLQEAQGALNDGTLVWLYDDGSGLRTSVAASQFNVAPGNTAAQNASGINAMRTNLLGQ